MVQIWTPWWNLPEAGTVQLSASGTHRVSVQDQENGTASGTNLPALDPLLVLKLCLQIGFVCQAPCLSWCKFVCCMFFWSFDMMHGTKLAPCLSQQYLWPCGSAHLCHANAELNAVVQVLTGGSVLQQDKSRTHMTGIVKTCLSCITVQHVQLCGMQVEQLQPYLVFLLHQASPCHCWHPSPRFLHHPCCRGSCWTFYTHTVL